MNSTFNCRRLLAFLVMSLCAGMCRGNSHDSFISTAPPANGIWLETLENLHWIRQGYRIPGIGTSVDENPMTMAGQVYPHGIGTHADSEINIDLHGGAVRFASMVGVDDEGSGLGSVVFEIYVDGVKKADSGLLKGLQSPKLLEVDLAGAQRLRLLVNNGGDGYHYDHANWGGAFIELKDPACIPTIVLEVPIEATLPIAAQTSRLPRINGPRVVGTTPKRPFLFRIPVSGQRPMRFTASGLPKGVTLDAETGVLTGSVPEEGDYKVRLSAENRLGQAERNLTIVAGSHKLALTPPMGWNSWNIFALRISAKDIERVADLMVETGLADVGFCYVNIDDGWENGRDENGFILPNEKFPDMKALADYVHKKGLKLGIYSSPGPQTCGLYEGSWQHERQDAQRWAEWGIDYLKYDWCLYNKIAKNETCLEELQKPYILMRKLLDEQDRDIVYSLCQYGMGKVWEWGKDVGGNLWRTTGDITDKWNSMSSIGFDDQRHGHYAGPGHWNDLDMMVVGWVGWGEIPYPARLLPNEQITHVTLWAMKASPMLLGCDLSKMDRFTLDLLTNPEVIDVHQDPLGKQAERIWKDGDLEIWARPCWDGTYAVGLFNRSLKRQPVTLPFSLLKLTDQQPVRDLWQNKKLGDFEEVFTADVPIHGAVLVKVGNAVKNDF